MKIIINNSSMQPIYEQLVEQIKAQIINGQLHENDVLPSVRALSKELKISALTVKKAYDHLYSNDSWQRYLCKRGESRVVVGGAAQRSRN